MEGWIKLHRKITNHWLFKEKRQFSNFEAWIDILMDVNHANKKVLIGSTLFEVKTGESINSLDTWSKRWNWNKSKVRRFLKLLEVDEMILIKNETKTTRLIVCNYESYQHERNANETEVKRKRNASETHLTPNKNDNNDKNDNNENNQIDVDKINFVDLLNFFNKTFNKKCRVFSNEAKRKYKARLKEGYTKDDIANAMRSCSLSKWHKESNYKDCTLEFFSRANILDKYAFNSQTKNNYIATK